MPAHKVLGDTEPESPPWRLRLELRDRLSLEGQKLPGMRQQRFAIRRQSHSVRVAVDEPSPQIALQTLHMLADR